MNKNAIKYLRGISHDIKPVVMIADKGLTDNVMHEIEIALDRHELVKLKIRQDRETRTEFEKQIIANTGATKIHSIGQTLTLFRRNPDEPVYELPKN
jgi:RNA-binding protein